MMCMPVHEVSCDRSGVMMTGVLVGEGRAGGDMCAGKVLQGASNPRRGGLPARGWPNEVLQGGICCPNKVQKWNGGARNSGG